MATFVVDGVLRALSASSRRREDRAGDSQLYVDEIVASDGTQASDGNAGFSMIEREAAIASFHRHGTGVKNAATLGHALPDHSGALKEQSDLICGTWRCSL